MNAHPNIDRPADANEAKLKAAKKLNDFLKTVDGIKWDFTEWAKALPAKLEAASNKAPEKPSVSSAYQLATYCVLIAGALSSFAFVYFATMPFLGPLVNMVTGNHTTDHLLLAVVLFVVSALLLVVGMYRYGQMEGRSFRQSVIYTVAVVMGMDWLPEASVGLIGLLLILAFIFN